MLRMALRVRLTQNFEHRVTPFADVALWLVGMEASEHRNTGKHHLPRH